MNATFKKYTLTGSYVLGRLAGRNFIYVAPVNPAKDNPLLASYTPSGDAILQKVIEFPKTPGVDLTLWEMVIAGDRLLGIFRVQSKKDATNVTLFVRAYDPETLAPDPKPFLTVKVKSESDGSGQVYVRKSEDGKKIGIVWDPREWSSDKGFVKCWVLDVPSTKHFFWQWLIKPEDGISLIPQGFYVNNDTTFDLFYASMACAKSLDERCNLVTLEAWHGNSRVRTPVKKSQPAKKPVDA